MFRIATTRVWRRVSLAVAVPRLDAAARCLYEIYHLVLNLRSFFICCVCRTYTMLRTAYLIVLRVLAILQLPCDRRAVYNTSQSFLSPPFRFPHCLIASLVSLRTFTLSHSPLRSLND